MSSPPLTRPASVLLKPLHTGGLNNAFLVKLYRGFDLFIALAVLLGVFMIHNRDRMPHGIDDFLEIRVTLKNLVLLVILSLAWHSVCNSLNLYNFKRLQTWRDEFIRIVIACSVSSLAVLLFPLTSASGSFSFRVTFYFWLASIAAISTTRITVRSIVFQLAPGRKVLRHVVIVGSGQRALKLYHQITTDTHAGYKFLGFIDSDNNHNVPEEIRRRQLGDLNQLEDILTSRVVDEVLIALPIKSCYNDIEATIQTCERVGVESMYPSDLFQPSLAKPRYEQRAEQLTFVAMKLVHDDYRFTIKRMIDVVGAVFGIIVLSPLMLLIAVAIKLTSRGPVIFTQHRYGFNKRLFKMYKFRTMVSNAEVLQESLEHLNEVAGPVFKIKNDPRVNRFGHFLRKSSLDELPQLFNVIHGEMSLVGPRPLPIRDVKRFDAGWLMRRFCMRPGLTCLWQISGRSNTDFERWIELDLKYIDEWSLRLDLEILVKTLPAVLRGAGAT